MAGMVWLLRICLGVMAAPLLLTDGAADISTPAFLPPGRPLGVPQSGMSLCKIGHLRGVLATPFRCRVDLSAKKKEKHKKPGGGGFGKLGPPNPKPETLQGSERWMSAEQAMALGIDILDEEEEEDEDLEARAVQEEALQVEAARAPPSPPCTEPETVAAVLREEGVVRVGGVVSAGGAQALRAAVIAERDRSEACGAGERDRLFTEVLAPSAENGVTTRWDVRMQITAPATRQALAAMLQESSHLAQALELIVGPDAEVIELAAFINAPGAVRQALHADTLFSQDAALYTVFVALQDTSDEMGATVLLPKSHTAAAHRRSRHTSSSLLLSSFFITLLYYSRHTSSSSLLLCRPIPVPSKIGQVAFADRSIHLRGRN